MQAELSSAEAGKQQRDADGDAVQAKAADGSENDPEGSATDMRTVAIIPEEEDATTLTDNPIFVQNVWEMPPTRGGFYLEDIMEERTVDLAQSGYVVAPSGLIAQSTLDSLPRSAGEALSPSKKLPNAEQSSEHQRRHSSCSSLHQSLQSNTQHSLHDSLSDS